MAGPSTTGPSQFNPPAPTSLPPAPTNSRLNEPVLTDEDYSFLDEGESTTVGTVELGNDEQMDEDSVAEKPRRRGRERTYRLKYSPLKIQKGGMKGREHIDIMISVFAYAGLLIPVGLYVLSLFVRAYALL